MNNQWRWFWGSCLLSLATLPLYVGSLDENMELMIPVTGWTPPFFLQGRCIWYFAAIKWLYQFFGGNYYLYRLAIMVIGLSALTLLAVSLSKTRYGVIAMASLIWMPQMFESLRILRYDMLSLLLVSLQIFWLVRFKIWGFLFGALAGIVPLITMSAVPSSLAMSIIVLFSWDLLSKWNRLGWLLGFALATLYILHVYPADLLSFSRTRYINLYGNSMFYHTSPFQASFKDYWNFFGTSIIGHNTMILPLIIGCLVAMVMTIRTSVWSRFALLFSLTHWALTFNPYPMVIAPIFIAGGFYALG